MLLNENTALSTQKALLAPYDRRHVLRYHSWMEDPAIQEATASEPLSLEEEYGNQASWRASRDKLTFIICQPIALGRSGLGLRAGEVDSPDKMIGDVNFFLYPWDGDDDEVSASPEVAGRNTPRYCIGEIDIMIAESQERGKGLGRTVVLAFIHYIYRNLTPLLQEYDERNIENRRPGSDTKGLQLKLLMAKIKETNTASISLFKGLGFQQSGPVNYFGEVKLVLDSYQQLASKAPEGYTEMSYVR